VLGRETWRVLGRESWKEPCRKHCSTHVMRSTDE